MLPFLPALLPSHPLVGVIPDLLLCLLQALVLQVSLVAQTVKNLPAMQETGVQSLGGEDPLEEGMATHSTS